MQNKGERIKGIGALVLTPFKENYELNLEAMEKNINYMIDSGIDETRGFLIANGSTGECYAMSMEERKSVIKKVVETAKGRVPVMAGCNDTNVFNVIELANYAQEVGAEAAMVVQPYYLPYNDDQFYNFYSYINDNVDIPIMVYNNPSVGSGSDMSINLLRELAELDSIFALKETTPQIKRFFQTQTLTDDIKVFSGSSSLQPFGCMAKMSGFISFLSNFNAELQVKLWDAIAARDYEKALELHTEELRLYDWWWSGNVKQTFGQVVHGKKAMDLVGLNGGYARPPLLPLEEEQIEGLKGILKKWELIPQE